ncbi:hypothetical protein LMG1873_05183 [Achromobacter piechaudii]|uniref:Uncharacterized protein n=3 Tax=Achromobacter piechaudii TaxID=72556 RepID=A0A6S7BVM4_9BURK|nr:hypothetical protein HMPREF0004_5008 [Achromobacter piechaudii ATCC 43553]CAB3735029.1 hypothetical protein LMG1873_05183 [Achromobacter piechaudii]CAB3819815.1 hypothetical protein LMG1861_00191 [Achromobacter piechaudii]CAB3916047.1 hypothetical protein LMG2828_05272 [Achromobacter piechaudii]CAB3955506.1 hypothetical protein LMG6103_04496 [Achromobacter piechaudii]
MHAMTSLSLRGILAAIALLAATPAAHAWTRISCDLAGTVTTPALQMRQSRTDGTALSQTTFRIKVKAAAIPEGARADTDCTEFVNRELDVSLQDTPPGQIRLGKPIKLRYRYDESLGEAMSTTFELVK